MEIIGVKGSTLSGGGSADIHLNIENSINCIKCHKGIETQPLHYLKIDSSNI